MQFTKAQIRSMKFRENGLRLNGERVRVTQLLRTGDTLEIGLEEPDTDSGHLEPEQEPIRILYEDEDLLAVWKESGLVLHPAHGHYQDTLSNRVHAYFQQKGERVRIRSIGRLDRDTSGIVVFAKNQIAAARLWKQKEAGVFWKEYQVVCEGVFAEAEGTIDTPIARLAGEKMKMCVSPAGSPSVTHYRVIRREQDRTHLLVRIETGRTHQIRVHMASIGHPVVGDVLYGTEDVQGLQLCAWKTELLQPFSGKRIVLKA
jgi:23S rRNA pseudouridine1911/1915/1917 synthase